MADPVARCHALPCNIEKSCKAPCSIYFRPTALDDDDENNDGIEAACFRGRGLLAQKAAGEEQQVLHLLRLVEQKQNGGGETKKKLQPVLKCILQEWHHEHQPNARALQLPGRGRQVADWMEVSQALHDPLPPME